MYEKKTTGMVAVRYNQTVEGYIICDSCRKEGFEVNSEKLTDHANTDTKGVWWEIGPEFSLDNARITMRAGDTSKIPVYKCKEGVEGSEKNVPPDNPSL